ncbi:RagB/SusD family nutrient uptake outer membrane protein [Butyricimonas synergistica]|uniref:RagB/SusD family nutrient uptake outer membrane protein n=1 Tax=Butyricimonas synergistica TaxID=544644 RepID=UPI00036D8785|nr:RagB/SusD family nutrient uptake outer membrane protein [Butyricimonas synergistica]
MKRYTIYIWCFWFLLSGCGDFLEEQSQDLTYAVNCADLEELLVGNAYAYGLPASKTLTSAALKSTDPKTGGYYFPGLHVMDDDVTANVFGQEQKVSTQPYSLLGAFYRWDENTNHDGSSEYDDPNWIRLYTHIGVTNAVLSKVDEFTEEPEADRNRVKGQALFLRAYYYYFLVNLYAKPYSAITADTDLGVPLKTFAYVDDRYWGRASVDSVYHQIVRDLQGAVACLEGMEMKNRFWANEDAARLLLGRVYCYMGKWELVPELYEKLFRKYALADIVADNKAPYISVTSPELIFTMGQDCREAIFKGPSNSTGTSAFGISSELEQLYKTGDARLMVRCSTELESGRIYPKRMDPYASDMFTLRISEAYLNQAEALAMTGDEAGARALIQQLREKRIAAGNVGTVTESGEQLIQFIREERRRELCFEGHRWFDLRRYAVCPNYPESKEIRHISYVHTSGSKYQPGMNEGYYLLDAYPAKNWVLPIPAFDVEENQGRLEQNERNKSILY